MTTTLAVSPESILAQLRALALKLDPQYQSEPQHQITVNVDAELFEYDHISDYKVVEQDLARAATRSLDNLKRSRKYDNVLALAIYWHKDLTDRPHLAVDAEKLLDVFKEKFGYRIDRHILTNEDTYKALNKRLVSLDEELSSKTEENLLILYYGGHGGLDDGDSKARLWLPNLRDGARTVDWNKLQSQLEESDFDILFLFDCCYAMSMPNSKLNWRQRCEIVGSSGPREKAGGRPETSFTAAVTELLEDDYKTIGCTNAWRLGSIMKGRDYKRKLKSTPDYEPLCKGCSTIPLEPMNPESVPPDGASSVSSHTLQDTLTSSDARITFSIAMASVPKEAKEFQRMLDVLPPTVTDVKVGVYSQKLLNALGLFQSNSALAFLSVPVWFWCVMPKSPAYKYIGLVRSENLLEEVQRQAQRLVLTERYCSRGMQTEDSKREILPVKREDLWDAHRKRPSVAWNSSRSPIITRTQSSRIATSIQRDVSSIPTEFITAKVEKLWPELDKENVSSFRLFGTRGQGVISR